MHKKQENLRKLCLILLKKVEVKELNIEVRDIGLAGTLKKLKIIYYSKHR